MRTVLNFDMIKETQLPAEFINDDVRFPKSLPLYFIEQFTLPGEVVFDPFGGYGTTLIAAEELGRVPYGIEFDPKRASYIQTQITNKSNIINGDSLKLTTYNLPKFDFVFTSPPYMASNHLENPFTSYSTIGEGYVGYLRDIESIFSELKKNMNYNKYVVVEIANIKNDFVTTLAWDVCKVISNVLTFEKEIIINWNSSVLSDNGVYGFGYDHSYCLVFKS